jgi:NAD(P)-dependent dehydrogenase (short-subunit alcohol dehydrogenase family)
MTLARRNAVMPAPVIIVTGVSRGIGRAIAEELQSRGAAVVGAARNVADVPLAADLRRICPDCCMPAN